VLSVTVTAIDADNGDELELLTVDLQPNQVTSQSIIAARFRFEFDYPAGGAHDAGVCTIDIGDAEQVQFAAIAGGVAITTGGAAPAEAAEMVVETASRCAAGEVR
jgi:hypothetical protein